MTPFYRPTCQGYILRLTVAPGARRTEVVGLHGDSLKVRVAAAPEKGAANQELLSFLAQLLKLPKTSLKLRQGAASRTKIVEVFDLTPELRARLQGLVPAAK